MSQLLVELSGTGRAIQWLSSDELLYEDNGSLIIWNTITEQERILDEELQVPDSWYLPFYVNQHASDYMWTSRYFDIQAYEESVALQNDDTPTISNVTDFSGFDIYNFSSGVMEHIPTNDFFIQSLEWSPNNQEIVVSSNPSTTPDLLNGIYIYDVTNKSFEQVGNFPAMNNLEYGSYDVSWSYDGEQLSFRTPDGYIVYDLNSQSATSLDDAFNSAYMWLSWSPIMDYSNDNCD